MGIKESSLILDADRCKLDADELDADTDVDLETDSSLTLHSSLFNIDTRTDITLFLSIQIDDGYGRLFQSITIWICEACTDVFNTPVQFDYNKDRKDRKQNFLERNY